MINAKVLSNHILDGLVFCEQDLKYTERGNWTRLFNPYFHKFITFDLDLLIKDKMKQKVIF